MYFISSFCLVASWFWFMFFGGTSYRVGVRMWTCRVALSTSWMNCAISCQILFMHVTVDLMRTGACKKSSLTPWDTQLFGLISGFDPCDAALLYLPFFEGVGDYIPRRSLCEVFERWRVQTLRYSSGDELSVLYCFLNVVCLGFASSRMYVGVEV